MRKWLLLPIIVMALLATASAAGCKAYWSFNTSMDTNNRGLADACSHLYNLTNHSADDGKAGVFNDSYKLIRASSTYLDDGDLDLAGDWTFCGWVNPVTITADWGIIAKYPSDNMANYIISHKLSNHSIRLMMGDGGGAPGYTFTYSNQSIAAGNWYHICVQYDNTAHTAQFWMNNTRAGDGPATTAEQINGANVDIGKTAGFADAYFDEFWMFDYLLSTTEIENLFLYGNLTGVPAAGAWLNCTVNSNTPAANYHNNSAYNTFTGDLTCWNGINATACWLMANGTNYGENTTMTNGSSFTIINNASWADNAYEWNFTCTNGTNYNSSANRTLVIDTVNPVANVNITTMTNFSYGTNYSLRASCADTNQYNMSADIYWPNGTVWRTNINNTDSYGNTTYYLDYEFTSNMSFSRYSTDPIGSTYWINITCVDSHTKKRWKADQIINDAMNVKIKKDGKWVLLDWDNASTSNYSEPEDRVKWGFAATVNVNGNIRETVKLKCDDPLYLLDPAEGHFVCGQFWTDFSDLASQGYTFTYDRVTDYKYKIHIRKNNMGAPGDVVWLDPATGGMNFGSAAANFTITYGVPAATFNTLANNSNYTVNDLHYTNATCTNGSSGNNLTNITITFDYPNATQISNFTRYIQGNNTWNEMARVPLNLSVGGSGFNMTVTCFDNNSNYTRNATLYNVNGANSVTAWDGINMSIIPNWNATIGTVVYHGGQIEDWFNDTTIDANKWWTYTNQTANANADVTETGETIKIQAYASAGIDGRSANATLMTKLSFKGYPIHFAALLNTTTASALLHPNATIYLTDNSSLNYYFTSSIDNQRGNWTFYTLNYTTPNITIYRDGLLNDSIDVSAWANVYLAASTGFVPIGGPATVENATVEIDFVAAPRQWVETSDWGAGTNTLTVNNATFGTITAFNVGTFDIGTLQYYFNTTNITLNRTGFNMNVFDEITNAQITWNATIYNTTVSYAIINSATAFFYAFNDTTGWAGFPTGNNITVIANSTGYASRTYYMSIDGTDYNVLNAYLLASGSGIWATFFAVTSSWQAIPNATIQFYKNFNITSITLVAEATTDSFGSTQQYLDPLTTYTYYCSAPSYTTVYGTVTPIATTYYIIMGNNTGGILNFTDVEDFFWHAMFPPATAVDTSTEIIGFRINDPEAALAWFRMAIINSSGNTIWSQNQTTPTGGSSQINLSLISGGGNLTNDKPFTAQWSYNRHGIIIVGGRQYFPTINYSQATTPGFMRAMSRVRDQLSDSPSPSLAIISSFVLAVGAGLVGGAVGFGGGFVVIGIGFFLAFMGFLPWEIFSIAAVIAVMAFLTIGRRYG